MPEKNYEYYKQLVLERGPILKSDVDCGCLECQVSYAWIEDGAPGLAEHHEQIRKALEVIPNQ